VVEKATYACSTIRSAAATCAPSPAPNRRRRSSSGSATRAGADPARVLKTLVIDKGRRSGFTVMGNDATPSTFRRFCGIVIEKPRMASGDEKRTRDVKAKLQHLVIRAR